MRKAAICLALAILLTPILAHAKPKKKLYNNSAEQVFRAALRTARERHVVTYVDEKQLMITFETGMSAFSYGFIANASVEPEGDNSATLVLNVQKKKELFSMGAGDRMADKFFKQVAEELAGDVSQKSATKPEERSIDVPPPKAVPDEPTMTKPALQQPGQAVVEMGIVSVSSVPDGAEIYVDSSFIGNTPGTLKLAPDVHTIKVTAAGMKAWIRELRVLPSSEVRLNAILERELDSPNSRNSPEEASAQVHVRFLSPVGGFLETSSSTILVRGIVVGLPGVERVELSGIRLTTRNLQDGSVEFSTVIDVAMGMNTLEGFVVSTTGVRESFKVVVRRKAKTN